MRLMGTHLSISYPKYLSTSWLNTLRGHGPVYAPGLTAAKAREGGTDTPGGYSASAPGSI